MHKTSSQMTNRETPNQLPLWSVGLMLVTVIATLDVITGGLMKESLIVGPTEYGMLAAFAIVTVGVYASDGSPGLKFVRACSRHKL